jgi:N-acetylglucosaminyldiphosphoundecaprenol N-acetyl-beta-D-mannosaminyltransferase
MPVLWISRLFGIPIRERLAGSDLFDALKSRPSLQRRLKIFLFGGGEGVAADLANTLNDNAGAMECVGTLYPGYGSVEDMSQTHIFDAINSSGAELLAVFLGAEKAQKWLLLNHQRLKIPVRINFGATINFQTGTVKRAPKFMRSSGLEWLWRIKEEPYLWRRYWADGKGLIFLVLTAALPYAISNIWKNQKKNGTDELFIERSEDDQTVIISLSGSAINRHVDKAIAYFRNALLSGKHISVDLSGIQRIDPRFFGLFLMVNKHENRRLVFKGISSRMKRTFRWNGFGFLLDSEAPLDRIL